MHWRFGKCESDFTEVDGNRVGEVADAGGLASWTAGGVECQRRRIRQVQHLSGDRVELRPWCPSDAAFAFDLYSRWDVQRYLGRDPKVMEAPAQANALIARLAAVDDPVLGYWVVQVSSTGEPVGTVLLQGIRLTGTNERSDQIEIGWHFHPDAWGRGYATEAAKVVMHHGFDAGLERIIAVTHPENVASQRVCHRLGMKEEGVTSRYYDVECQLFVATSTPV